MRRIGLVILIWALILVINAQAFRFSDWFNNSKYPCIFCSCPFCGPAPTSRPTRSTPAEESEEYEYEYEYYEDTTTTMEPTTTETVTEVDTTTTEWPETEAPWRTTPRRRTPAPIIRTTPKVSGCAQCICNTWSNRIIRWQIQQPQTCRYCGTSWYARRFIRRSGSNDSPYAWNWGKTYTRYVYGDYRQSLRWQTPRFLSNLFLFG